MLRVQKDCSHCSLFEFTRSVQWSCNIPEADRDSVGRSCVEVLCGYVDDNNIILVCSMALEECK